MAVTELGHAAVASGWRKAVADVASPRVAGATPLRERDVRAAIGVALFAISALYVAKTLRNAAAYRR